jgi:4-amino-4-deoxy-L-arabinose transferase-like glycosyltransferase
MPRQKQRKKTERVHGAVDPRVGLDESRSFRWRDRRDLAQLGIVLAVAFALRLVFFFLNQRNNPVFLHPILDGLYHHEWAQDILAGGARGDDVFFRGPLYPYLLAALYKLGGSSIAFAVFAQHAMGTATTGLVYLLTREYFSPRVALWAGVGAALYWPFVYFEGDLLIVTTFIFLNTISFLLFAKGLRTGRKRWLAAAGLALGLSAIARPSILILLPAVPLVLFLRASRTPRDARAWVWGTLVFAATMAVPIAPVMVRNYMVARAIVPVGASGGVNFYIGNNPASDGSTAIVPGTRADWWGGYEDAIAIAERDRGRKLDLAEVSDYYFERGLEFFTVRPTEAWRLVLKKFRMFWAGPERANNKFIYFFWNLAGMKYVPLPGFWLVAPLGLLGMTLAWSRRRELSLFYLFVLLYSMGVVAFFVNSRFRLPIMPVLIMFAAYAAAYVAAAYRVRSFGLVRSLVVLAVVAGIVNSDYLWFRQIREYSNAFSHNTLGNAYLKMGRKDTALGHFQKADEINARFPTPAYELIARDVNYNLGLLLWEQGRCSRAIDVLAEVGGSDIKAVDTLDRLGDCYLKRGELNKAAGAYGRLAQIDRHDIRGVVGMARCHAAAGDLVEAERMLSQVVDPNQEVYPPAYLALAAVQRAMGRLDDAIESYTDIARFGGYEREALIALAECYHEKGDTDAVLRTLEQARLYFPPGDSRLNDLRQRLRAPR